MRYLQREAEEGQGRAGGDARRRAAAPRARRARRGRGLLSARPSPLRPDHPPALCLLGLTLIDSRGFQRRNRRARTRAGGRAAGFAPVQLALGSAYSAAGHDEYQLRGRRDGDRAQARRLEPDPARAAREDAGLRVGRTREAIGYLRRVLRRDPTHAQARYLLAGLTGDKSPEVIARPPPDLIAELFDTYSTTFEAHLTGSLQYGVPAALIALVDKGADSTVIDLGCGTGLVGVEAKPFARTLIGSDISPRMMRVRGGAGSTPRSLRGPAHHAGPCPRRRSDRGRGHCSSTSARSRRRSLRAPPR